MTDKELSRHELELEARQRCTCKDCGLIRQALTRLDDIATSSASMGFDDIEDLYEARNLLARVVGAIYNGESNRHEGCKLCHGPLVLLGQLGRFDWYRCRNCGIDQNRIRKPRKQRKVSTS